MLPDFDFSDDDSTAIPTGDDPVTDESHGLDDWDEPTRPEAPQTLAQVAASWRAEIAERAW